MMMKTRTFLAIIVFVLLNVGIQVTGSSSSSHLKVVNTAIKDIDLFWVNALHSDKILEEHLHKMSTIKVNGEADFQSFTGHKFLVRFHDDLNKVNDVIFIKGSKDETITLSSDDNGHDEREKDISTHSSSSSSSSSSPTLPSILRIQYTNSNNDVFEEAFDQINHTSHHCAKAGLKGDQFAKCLAKDLEPVVNRVTENKATLKKFRDKVSERLRNYTCADSSLETSPAISGYDYISPTNNITYKINVLLDSSHAKIWSINNFVSDEECQVLMTHGKPRLTRATVAAEDGSSIVSEHRKANQASYDFHPSDFQPTDPLEGLKDRVLSMQNYHTGYELDHDGQEGFTIIQYNIADQYTPHCDADCDGMPHHAGGRVATAVLYCKVAEQGGATTFTKSNIHVKPMNGAATFFSYWGPDGRMDPEQLTEHSGCPVTEGEKWITTFWMRQGVSAKEPWTVFDPSGIKMENVN